MNHSLKWQRLLFKLNFSLLYNLRIICTITYSLIKFFRLKKCIGE